jgi:hypothetical protein
MTTSSLRRLADARPELARRPQTIVSRADREALLASIVDDRATESPYVPDDVPAGQVLDLGDRRPERPRRPLLAAVAVLAVIAAIGLGLVLNGDDGVTVVPAGPSTPTTPEVTPDPAVPVVTPQSLPPSLDLATAPALFTTEDPLDEVVWGYLEDRFHLSDSLTVEPAVVAGTTATAHWRFGNPTEGTIAEGDVHLRQDGVPWSVVAMTTDGVDLSAVARTDGRVTGAVTSTNINSLALDVLDVDGQPVPRAPLEGGEDIDGNRFGTAGGTNGNGSAPLVLEVPVPEAAVVHVRALLLGGSILGVAEFALEPPQRPTPTRRPGVGG